MLRSTKDMGKQVPVKSKLCDCSCSDTNLDLQKTWNKLTYLARRCNLEPDMELKKKMAAITK